MRPVEPRSLTPPLSPLRGEGALVVRFLCLAALLAAAPAAAKINVAVLYFDNHTTSREYDVLSKGLADMLITDLAAASELQLVERARLEAVIAEIGLQRSKYFDPQSAVQVGKLLGASHIVTGAFTGFEPDIRIDVRLIEVQTTKVVVTAQVKGKRDGFFDLEQELVKRFLDALQQKLSAPQTGALALDTAVKYSQGLDTADKGDVKKASTQLASVVRAAPDFALGKARYSAMLEKLRGAGQKREAALNVDEQALVANIAAALAKPVTKKNLEVHFCYRGMRSAYLLWKIEQLAGPQRGPLELSVPARADLPAVKKLMGELWDNELVLLDEGTKQLETLWYSNFAMSCAMALYNEKTNDWERLRTLGIAFDNHYDTHPMERATVLAGWVSTGAYFREQPDHGPSVTPFRVLPTVATVNPSAITKTLAALDAAQKVGEKRPPVTLADATLELESARATLLVNAGRRDEGIAVLQSFLDRFPKSKSYRSVETTVEAMLGISDTAKKNDAALTECRADDKVIRREIDRVFDAEGAAGVVQRLRALDGRCPDGAKAVRQAATWQALMRGDCTSAKSFAAQAGEDERTAVGTLCD